MRIAIAGATGVVGRHVVEAARGRGHEPVALSRAGGVDVGTGDGLREALAGVDAVIDTANAGTTDEQAATDFFRRAAANLQTAAAEQGVGRIVTLSIVGIDRVPFGYYAAKLAHEQAAADGPVASTILRATQFHEFAGQLIAGTRDGGRATVLDLEVQTVAARTVAEALVETAEAAPAAQTAGTAPGSAQHRSPDLGGPEPARLVDLARRLVETRGEPTEIVADAESVAGLPNGALLPGPDARLAGPSYDEWLTGEDAAALAL